MDDTPYGVAVSFVLRWPSQARRSKRVMATLFYLYIFFKLRQMKRIILLPLLAISIYAQAQHKPKSKATALPFPQSTIKEFAECIRYEYQYGNGNMRALIFAYHQNDLPETAVKLEHLEKHVDFEVELLNLIWVKCLRSRNYFFSNLVGMHISATNAKILTDYVDTKNSNNEPSDVN